MVMTSGIIRNSIFPRGDLMMCCNSFVNSLYGGSCFTFPSLSTDISKVYLLKLVSLSTSR